MSSAFFRRIDKLSKEVLGFADMGVITLNAKLNSVYGSDSQEIYDHLKAAVINKHDWAKTVIVLVRPYTPYKTEFPHGFGVYSAHYKQYPLGRKASQILASFIEKEGFRAVSDSGIPVKPAAFCAGLGVYGKNSLIYTKDHGSLITIHSVVTDVSFDFDNALVGEVTDCRDCELCINTCPTKAIMHDGKLSKSRCLREHMLQKNIIPLEMRKLMGRYILGCDLCQIVCPKNKNRYAKAIFPPDDEAKAFNIENILSDSDDMDRILDFITNIVGANYAKKESILSAAVIIAGNIKEMRFVPHYVSLLNHQNPSIRSHAAWALAEIDVRLARELLKGAITGEIDEAVRLEMEEIKKQEEVQVNA